MYLCIVVSLHRSPVGGGGVGDKGHIKTCTTPYLRLLELRNFYQSHRNKAMVRVYVVDIYNVVYIISVGFGIAYLV